MWMLKLAARVSVVRLTVFTAKGFESFGPRVGLPPGFGSFLGAIAGFLVGFWFTYLVVERAERRIAPDSGFDRGRSRQLQASGPPSRRLGARFRGSSPLRLVEAGS